jgi:hypothetical protein
MNEAQQIQVVFVMLAYLFGWLVGRYGGKTWKN